MIKLDNELCLCIDAHAHVWKELVGQRFGNSPVEPLGFGKIRVADKVLYFTDPSYTDLSSPIEVFMEHMEKNGVDKAVLLQTPCYGQQYDYIDSIMREHEGKFKTVGLADPRFKQDFIRDVNIAINERRYFGIKFEVPDVPFVLDAPENDFVWETIMKNDTFIIIDMGWGNGPFDYPINQLTNVLKKYPAMKIILPHLGVSHLWDPNESPNYDNVKRTLALLDIAENLWFDMAGLPLLIRTFDEYPYPKAYEILKVVKETIGFDRVMWGTDYPCVTEPCTYKQTLDMVIKHCDFLTHRDKVNLLGANAQKVYFD